MVTALGLLLAVAVGAMAGQATPSVSTVSGSRPLNGNRNFVALAGLPESEDISSPFPFVEIRGQERTGIVRKHRIDAHNERGAIRVGPA
jgi:hypothetical protein